MSTSSSTEFGDSSTRSNEKVPMDQLKASLMSNFTSELDSFFTSLAKIHPDIDKDVQIVQLKKMLQEKDERIAVRHRFNLSLLSLPLFFHSIHIPLSSLLTCSLHT
eukprot:TRINITY_DN1744_c0_g1_i1.p2 TRINITY_DN1744_c0_g1~~TRINITY_DN1744_c0_g1_i1.p2  ORF type:complete len:124 (+),score=33.50 TRINITY_DN1744_c0_g1_i1:56-373(+)